MGFCSMKVFVSSCFEGYEGVAEGCLDGGAILKIIGRNSARRGDVTLWR